MKPLAAVAALALASTPLFAAPAQHYLCNKGYTSADCQSQYAVLKPLLDKYGADRLGDWTFVLVKSADWKSIHASDPDSPAYTVLDKRITVFEEALFTGPSTRGGELVRQWSMGLDDLRVLAVTHEFGHAMCNERDEHRADANGARLRQGLPAQCR
jgi:hypothetical protein